MTTAVRPAGQTTRYQHIGAINPMRGRPRHYVHDDDLNPDIYDVTAMERILNNEGHVTLNPAEQYETARQLHALYDAGHEIAGIRDGKRVEGQKEIARRVGVADRTIVRWAKDGWPPRETNPDGTLRPLVQPAGTLEERWAANTQPTHDGHRLWTGAHSNRGIPTFTYQRHLYQAARVAWLIKHGTEAQGSARPGCGIDLCVEPDHIEDRPNVCATKRRVAS